jgi:hypothetical protein
MASYLRLIEFRCKLAEDFVSNIINGVKVLLLTIRIMSLSLANKENYNLFTIWLIVFTI